MLEHCVLSPCTPENRRAHALRQQLEKSQPRAKPAQPAKRTRNRRKNVQ